MSRKLTPQQFNASTGDEVAIKVEHISKKYCKSLKRSMLYGVQDIGRNMIGLSSRSDRLRKNEFWAVDDISFEVKKGETLGIIGPNGAGKTTLLKMLNGIFWPDKGKITVKGRVGALIEVGAGFHPLLTGRENIYINAAILGMSKKEVDKKFDDIVGFAEIGDFIDSPVKFYSSGMFVRLGFAVAVQCEPDILLVDEVLAVGDLNFQRKCIRRMKELLLGGATVIFISHNIRAVQDICQKAILLNHGRVVSHSSSADVVKNYVDLTSRLLLRDKPSSIDSWALLPDKKVHVTKVVLLNTKGEETDTHFMRNSLHIRVFFNATEVVPQADFQIVIFTQDNIVVCCCNSKLAGQEPFLLKRNGAVDLMIDEELMPGIYILRGGVFDRKDGEPLDVWGTTDDRFIQFQVESSISRGGALWPNLGVINLRQKWLVVKRN
jgi:lipopolysaccharide transport system ATP-binding protein